MKTEVMSVSQFLNRKEEPFSAKVERHFRSMERYIRSRALQLF
jgi:hypothetical protein